MSKISTVKKLSLLSGIVFCLSCQTKTEEQKFPIQVYLLLSENYKIEEIKLNTAPSDFVMYPTYSRKRPQIKDSVASWSLLADKPIIMNATILLGPEYRFTLLEPGDSIVIAKKGTLYQFSGRGFEKLELLSDLNKMRQQKKTPRNNDYFTTYSIDDFEEWNRYSDEISHLTDSIFFLYESKIAYNILNIIKEEVHSNIEYKRLTKFGVLVNHQDTLKISTSTLDKIFDSIEGNRNLKQLISYTGNPSNYYTYYDLVRKQVQRVHHFNLTNDTLLTVQRKVECAKLIEKQYKGYVRQACLTYLVADQGMKDHWYKEGKNEPVIDSLLKRYYASPGYESYKAYMRRYEAKIKKWILNDKKKKENRG